MRNYRLVVRKHELIDYQKREFFSVNHNFYKKNKIYKKHWHNSIELTFVVKGEKIQTSFYGVKEMRITAKSGMLLLVNSGINHEIIVKEGLEGIVLLIDRLVIDEFYPDSTGCCFNLEKNVEAKNQIIQHMQELAEAKDKNDKVRQNILVLEIIKLLAEQLKDDVVYREKHDITSELIQTVMEYIEYNYSRQITLEEICGITNYNKSYLSSLFKKKMGITIFEYLKNVRLQHCLHDLSQTDDTIVNIALSNGFPNIQSFNKIFKETYHMTPMQYRKKQIFMNDDKNN